MSNSPAAAQAAQDNQRFWQGIQRLPEPAQRSFWDAGVLLSEQIGENPAPRVLKYDMSSPPKDMPWYERIFFYIGQSHYNQAVTSQAQSQALAEGAGWLWGALQGDFNKSPSTGQVVVGGIISLIPVVDQICDVRDIVANCLTLSDPKAREDNENWIALGLTCIGFVPEIGSAVKTVGKVALKNAKRLLDLLKHMEWLEKQRKVLKIAIPWGRAPIDWLRKFNWQAALKQAGDKAKAAFLAAKSKLEAAAKYTMGLVQAKTKQLVELFDTIAKKIGQVMSDLAQKIKDKIKQWLGKAEKEAGNYDAVPGKTTNKNAQGDREPPPDKRPKPRLTGVQTEKDTAFFWSGNTNGVGGQHDAKSIARSRGGKTLEMLIEERGIKMPVYDRTNPASVKAWADISAEFAKGASGEVRAVVGENVRATSIWLQKELPALKSNPAVTRITTIDPATLVETVIFKR
jgi:hypothetical protein